MSGHVKNKSNQSIKHANVIHSHLMRVLCESKPELIDMKIFWEMKKRILKSLKQISLKILWTGLLKMNLLEI